MHCPHCGQRVSENAKACGHCGRWLAVELGTPPPRPARPGEGPAGARGVPGISPTYQTVTPAISMPKRSLPGWVWALGGGLIILLVVLIGLVYAIGVALNSSDQSQAAPPRVASWSTQPVAAAAPTAIDVPEEATPVPPVTEDSDGWMTVVSEDFATDPTAWRLGSRGRVMDGTYQVACEDKCTGQVELMAYVVDDFRAAIDIFLVDDKEDESQGVGLYVVDSDAPGLPDPNNVVYWDSVRLWPSRGQFGVQRSEGTESTWIVEPTTFSAIKQELGALNRLEIEGHGSTITVKVNGQTLDTFDHPVRDTGILDLAVYRETIARFDNLEVWVKAEQQPEVAQIEATATVEREIGDLLTAADKAALDDKTEQAAELFTQGVEAVLNSTSARLNNNTCWFGCLEGFVDIVYPTCERAVELGKGYYIFRDSRGLARALSGDYEGAIEDFEVFVADVREVQGETAYERYGKKREQWIADLKAGRNPFDAETLAALRDE